MESNLFDFQLLGHFVKMSLFFFHLDLHPFLLQIDLMQKPSNVVKIFIQVQDVVQIFVDVHNVDVDVDVTF